MYFVELIQCTQAQRQIPKDENAQKMKSEYGVTVYKIFKSFKERNADVDDIFSAIECRLLQSGSVEICKPGQEITLQILRECILKNSSWWNCKLLQFVVECCGDKEERDILDQYINGPLKQCQELPIVEMPSNSFDYEGSSETHKRELCHEVPTVSDQTTLHNLKNISSSLEHDLGVPNLVFKRHEAGGSELYFGIPDKADIQSPASAFSKHTKWDEHKNAYVIIK